MATAAQESTTASSDVVGNRYDIVYFFDITDGNPNGDPDAGNLPRVDPETGQGLVTDVCLKRKIRNYVGLVKGEQPPYDIYVKERAVLNQQHARAWKEVLPKAKDKDRKNLPDDAAKAKELTDWMCRNFFDIRSFGAVMTTDVNCGQVRGPIQFGIARSIHPILPQEYAVTRCAVTTDREAKDQKGGNRTIGRKSSVVYGLYRVHIYINPHLAEKTHFTWEDLELFKQALDGMFENDRSAARASMRPVGCYAFKHDSPLGDARADQLFASIKVDVAEGVQPIKAAGQMDSNLRPPRSLDDYVISFDSSALPDRAKDTEPEQWI